MKRFARLIAGAVAALAILAPQAEAAEPFIADTPADQGVEPNVNTPTSNSEDIWVRRTPDPAYSAAPFAAASPPWTPQPHQDPRYADPRQSVPNWVYVRVRNRGAGPTPAGARLKLYWTKATGAQAWPAAWVDNMAPPPGGGAAILQGMEITKPRRNAANVTQAERNAYVQAILAIDRSGRAFPDGVTFWDKQNEIHSNAVVMPTAHVNPAFLPWHREFINRYEALLQTVNPTLKLLYWDWSQDPRQPINGVSFFTTSFMGAMGAGVSTPVGAPFAALMNPVQLMRNGRPANYVYPARPDAPALARAQYADASGVQGVRTFIEGGSYHNTAHVDIGGSQPATCRPQPQTCIIALSYVAQAARDPFFFMIHGNVDRLWAQWQRANPARYDARSGAAPYGLDSSNSNITRTMTPWDGSAGIAPWTAGSSELRAKTSLDPSVVSPPIYDTAPLRIPVLQAGQAVVLQIPWYPPDPRLFSGFANGRNTFAILARIETATTPPFGMTTAEGSDTRANVRNNNKIARRAVTVQDPPAAPVAAAAPAGTAAAAPALAQGAPEAEAEAASAPVAPFLGRGQSLSLSAPAALAAPAASAARTQGAPAAAAAETVEATLFVDGKAVETRRRAPFDFRWTGAAPGQYVLRIDARDTAGGVSSTTRVVTVAENLPPSARLTGPANGASFAVGAPIPVAAEASDPEGKIARVEFYAAPMAAFTDPVRVASVSAPPYAAQLTSLGAGTWMLSAVAVDAAGAQGQSEQIHIMVAPPGGMSHP